MEQTCNACRILVDNPLGKLGRRCEDNIKMDLREILWSVVSVKVSLHMKSERWQGVN
jgi:hypothetical protein